MANANLNSRQMSIFRAALCTLACALISTGVWAQDVSTTTTHERTVDVRDNGEERHRCLRVGQ